MKDFTWGTPGESLYTLSGIVTHLGSSMKSGKQKVGLQMLWDFVGHYVASIWDSPNEVSYTCDDEVLTLSSLDETLGNVEEDAYVVVFSKRFP